MSGYDGRALAVIASAATGSRVESEQMRLLYVLDSLQAGGAEQSLAAMCLPLQQRDISLTVAVLSPGGQHADEVRESGAALVEFDVTGVRKSAQAISGLIATVQPDVVHTTLYDADLAGRVAARRTRTPVTSTLTTTRYVSGWAPTLPRWKTLPVQATEIVSSRACARLHAVSNVVADSMSASLRYPRSRIDVVHRGRDPEILGRRSEKRRAEVRRRLGIAESTPVVLAVGRHDYVKGHDTAIRAFGASAVSQQGGMLLIAGREGRETDELHQITNDHELSGQVKFLGHRSDVADLMSAADILVSASRREGLPGTLIEALALEIPIVATELPQVTEVLGQHGNLAPVSDVKSMAESITDFFNRPAGEVANTASQGRVRFEHKFTLEASVDGLIEHWHQVIAS